MSLSFILRFQALNKIFFFKQQFNVRSSGPLPVCMNISADSFFATRYWAVLHYEDILADKDCEANGKHDTSHCWCHSVDRACLLCGENKQKMYLWFGFTAGNIVALMFSAAPSCSLPGFGLRHPPIRSDLIFKWQTREHKAWCCFSALNQPLSFHLVCSGCQIPLFLLFFCFQSIRLSSSHRSLWGVICGGIKPLSAGPMGSLPCRHVAIPNTLRCTQACAQKHLHTWLLMF